MSLTGTIKGNSAAMLALLFFVLTMATTLFSFYSGFPAALVFVGLSGAGVFFYLLLRAPQAFLVAVIFVPQWKGYWPFSVVDRVADLTLLMLGCLVVCLAFRGLAQIGRLDELALARTFYGQGPIILAYLLFATTVTVSYFYTTAPEYGASKLLRFLGIGSLLFVSPLFLVRSEQDFRRFVRIFIAFSGIVVVQLLTGLDAPASEGDVTRIGAGWLMGMAAIVLLFYPLFKSEASQHLFLVCSLPVLVLGLIASVARGPMVAILIVLMIRVGLWFKEGRRTTAIALAGVFLASGLGAFVLLRHAGGNRYTNKARELINLVEGDATRGSATTRLLFYKAALSEIPNRPLLGHGIGSWSTFYYGRDERAYPHNLFVEVAFEQGLLGLGALLFFLSRAWASTKSLWERAHSRYFVLGVLILYCLIIFMFSGDLDDDRLLWVWVGMTMAVSRNIYLQRLRPPCRVQLRAATSFSRPYWLHP